MTLSHDDPKLTAFALGELDDSQRSAVEAAIAASPELQHTVADIRAVADAITVGLNAGPALSLTAAQRSLVESRMSDDFGVGDAKQSRDGEGAEGLSDEATKRRSHEATKRRSHGETMGRGRPRCDGDDCGFPRASRPA